MRLRFEFDKVRGGSDLQEKIGKKFASLEKYLKNVKDDFHTGVVRVLKGERWGYRVRVDVKLPGKEVVAEGRSKTLLSAVDEAYYKSSRIIRKYFEKLKDKKK